jgi:uncharacterized repeat protein (TIGR02059 family)
MAVTYQQWLTAFDSTAVETGCTVTVASGLTGSDKNKVTATIASADDTHDQAVAKLTAAGKLPASEQGRLRFKFTTPSSFNLLGNSTILLVMNATGVAYDGSQGVIDLYIDANEKLASYTSANLLGAGSLNNVSGSALSPSTEYTVELAWLKNGYRRVWLNGTLIFELTGLTGATGSALSKEIRLGIDHYDGADTLGWTVVERLLQVAGDPAVALGDPGFSHLRDLAANEAIALTNKTATNTTPGTPDTTPPHLVGVDVLVSTLTLYFDEALDAAGVPAASAFAVRVNGSLVGVTNVAVTGSTAVLTLAAPTGGADVVVADYTKP